MAARVGTYLLVFLVAFKTFICPIIYLEFELSKDYIVQNLCENRTRPQLHCDGKCYLAKKIAAAKEKESQESARHYLITLVDVIADPSQLVFSTNFAPINSTVESEFNLDYQSKLLDRLATSGVFRPPLFP